MLRVMPYNEATGLWLDRGSYSHKPCIAITDLYYTDWIEGHALQLDTMLLLTNHVLQSDLYYTDWIEGHALTMKPLDTMLLLS